MKKQPDSIYKGTEDKCMIRDNTRVIKIGNRVIGGGNPILIQSMTNTPTEDVEATEGGLRDYPLYGARQEGGGGAG